MQRVREAQERDEALKIVRQWRQKPTWEEVARFGPGVKFWWARYDRLKERDGVWFYQWEFEGKIEEKMIIPRALQPEVLREHHDDRLGGHFGIAKTLVRLRKSL